MKICFLIPAYNEARTIGEVLERIASLGLESQVVVVDDGSTDETSAIALAAGATVIRQTNQGKGAAIRTAIAHADGDIAVIQDADMEYDPVEVPELIEPIIRGAADVVFGSRFMGGEPHRVHYFWHMVGNKFLTLLSNMFTNLNLTDMETCYKVFRRDVIRQFTIEENRFGVEPEITAKVSRLNLIIFEVGISYYGRSYAEGKKIGWRDGFRALWVILKYNLSS